MFKGRIILITGGGSGIGEAFATILAKDNKIVICGRNENKLKKVAATSKNISYYVADVSVSTEIDNLFKRIADDKITLDVLVNNAGVSQRWEIDKTVIPSAEIFALLNTNFAGAVSVIQQFVNQATKSAENVIINVTSEAALFPVPIFGFYGSTKAGLSFYTKVLRYQLKNTGFKVIEVMPPAIDTEMAQSLSIKAKMPTSLDFASKTIKALNKGRIVYAPGSNVPLLKFFSKFFPSIGLSIVDKESRKMIDK